MPPTDWQRVKAVLSQALDARPERRDRLLADACGDDLALRAEVESLLAEADADPATCPIEQFVESAFAKPSAVNLRQCGPYEVVRELGVGGMGTVYLARRSDGQFHHEVAVKVIRHASLREDLAPQFLRERQILAGLNHPHIAKLFDGGLTSDGDPYLVMEYVDGVPLVAYVADQAQSVDARLRLVLQVCDAVAYAHAKLVVHRDIKPSNVLVTSGGMPKLVDFGLARMLDDSMRPTADATLVGLRAFTPAYAAPEHLQGLPATTAGDIYALGVLLYELLTGRTPYDVSGKDVWQVLQTIEATRPVPPSVAALGASGDEDGAKPRRVPACPSAQLRGDLDTIVLKAINPDPGLRYQTVRELADDIGRHLDGRPVLARTPTPIYRARKFVRRHRAAVVASVAVALGLVAMMVVTVWQARVARIERDRAARRFSDVRRLANDLLFELAPRIERLSGATDARVALLERALTYLDSLAAETEDDPQLRRELAVAYEKVGDLQGNPTNPNLVDLDAAVSSYEKAQVLRRRSVEADPEGRETREALAENHRVLGTVLAQANEFDRSTSELSAAATLYRALVAESPRDIGLRLQLARAIQDVGRNESNTKRYTGSLPHFEEAITLAREAQALEPDGLAVNAVLADSHAQLGLALSWESRQAEAETQLAEAVRIQERALAARPTDAGVAGGLWSAYWISSIIFEEQDDARAHEFSLKALALARRTTEADPANIRGRQQLAKSLSRAGQTATNVGQSAEALGHLEESTTLLRDIAEGEVKNGRLRSDLALALTRLADAQRAQGRLGVAMAQAREADKVYQAVAAENPDDKRTVRNRVVVLELLGDIYARLAERGEPGALQGAGDSYDLAANLMRQLDSRGALATLDRPYVEKLAGKAAAIRR